MNLKGPNSISLLIGLQLAFDYARRGLQALKYYKDMIVIIPYSLTSEALQRLIFHLIAVEPNKDSVIVFEEPEGHAFPYYVKYLAERIALNKDNQFFISTHNPYMLLPLVEKAEDLRIFVTYVKDYQTKVKTLK